MNLVDYAGNSIRLTEEARLYYRFYEGLSIGNKHLCIVVKFKEKEAFVITAYFTDIIKKGEAIWRK